MTRNEKLLSCIEGWQRKPGLEIGPLTTPILSKSVANVKYVDRASTEEIKRHYAAIGLDTAAILDVDFVWQQERLREVTHGETFHYCLSSHNIEHVPDLLGYLQQIAEVLAPAGIAALAIPDGRFTFDCLRSPSSLAEIVEAHLKKARQPAPHQVFDHISHYVEVDAAEAWKADFSPAHLVRQHSLRHAYESARESLGTYLDVHCWVFTPGSFLDILVSAAEIGLISFEIAAFYPTEPNTNEFLVCLRRLSPELSPEERWNAMKLSSERFAFGSEIDRPCQGEAKEATDAMLERIEALEAENAALRTSTSWRVTAPLRAIARLLRR